MDTSLVALQQRIGHRFNDPALLERALTHRSSGADHNERLEFLGDAVLNLVVARHLFMTFPAATEGDLSRLRARVVSAEPLAEIAASIGLGDELQLGSGELKTGGFRRQSILADALEAVCGALFLDGGLEAAEKVILRLFEARIAALPAPETLKDAKTRLQEYLQSRGYSLPRYTVDRIEGEAHAQTFHIVCEVTDLKRCSEGSGSSRRRAEQEAAAKILQELPDAI